MSELNCERVGAQIDEAVTGCTSWVELGQTLSEAEQSHLSACPACRSRAVELLELERQLTLLSSEPLPGLDLTAGVMARLQTQEKPQRFPLLAWTPMLLVLAYLLPDPAWMSAWLPASWNWGWSLTLPEFSLGLTLPEFSLASGAVDGALVVACMSLVVTTWSWRNLSRA